MIVDQIDDLRKNQPFSLFVLLAELAADGDQLALVLLALLVHRLLNIQC